jgi:uncharacterized membrane protein YfcA
VIIGRKLASLVCVTNSRLIVALNLHTLGFLWLGAFLGSVASAGTGFAFVLTASAIWLHALDPLHTAMVGLACSLLMQFGTVWALRRSIVPARLWPFVAGGVIGLPIGVMLLTRTDQDIVKGGLGAFLVAYGAYALFVRKLPEIALGGRSADAAVGLLGGVLGGLAGYTGALPTIWTQLRGWPKNIARATYQPYIIIVSSSALVSMAVIALDRTSILLFAAALPAMLAGGLVGWSLYGRLNDRRFRQTLAVLLLVSGLTLVL